MAVIPGHIFRVVENRLHHVCSAWRRAEDARDEEILSEALGGGDGYAVATGASHTSDRTARVALRLQEPAMAGELAAQWGRVIGQVRGMFSGCSEGLLFERYYGLNITVKQLAEQEHYDRQTINRYREKVVSHCALLAAEKGLLKWGGA